MRRLGVILVEDEVLILEELKVSIPWKEYGFEVLGTAGNGIDGERIIEELDPDIVITDIRLPGKTGLEMLEAASVEHGIILSGYTDFNYMQKAIRLGVFDYLQKPIDSRQFHETLSGLVEKMRQEDQAIERLKTSDPELIALPRNVGNHVINSVIAFIAANYSRPVGLQEAAQYLELSESHLSRLFKEETGLNFLQYLNAFRVNKAAQLMKDPRKNISQIAAECGFPSPGYFAKIFRRFSGQTPTSFRDNMSVEQ